MNIKPDTYDRLEKIVAAVFSKAIEEQHFAKIYAKVCRNFKSFGWYDFSFAKTATRTGTRTTRSPSSVGMMALTRQSLVERLASARSSQRASERFFWARHRNSSTSSRSSTARTKKTLRKDRSSDADSTSRRKLTLFLLLMTKTYAYKSQINELMLTFSSTNERKWNLTKSTTSSTLE